MLNLKDELFNTLNLEKETYENNIKQLTNERDMWKKCIETAHIEQKKYFCPNSINITNEELNKKNNELNEQLYKIEKENIELLSKIKLITADNNNIQKDLTQQLNQSKSECDILNKSINILNDKYKNIESAYKLKVEELSKVKTEIEGFKKQNSTKENLNDKLNITNEELNKKNNKLNEQFHKIEK